MLMCYPLCKDITFEFISLYVSGRNCLGITRFKSQNNSPASNLIFDLDGKRFYLTKFKKNYQSSLAVYALIFETKIQAMMAVFESQLDAYKHVLGVLDLDHAGEFRTINLVQYGLFHES